MSIVPGVIAILQGGPSPEAAVSRVSAGAVAAALTEMKQPHQVLELADNWVQQLGELQPKFVFIALHGTPGEDGSVQGLLELLGLAYNGSGVAASALAMHKHHAKIVLKNSGIKTPKGVLVEVSEAVEWTQFPAVVKPLLAGSSVGVSIVENQADLPTALQKAWQHGAALIEEYIPGKELTVGVLDGNAQGVVEILPQGDCFYDYSAKYDVGGSTHVYPAEIKEIIAKKAQKWAALAHQTLACTGATRVDFRYDEKSQQLVVLEVNTLPGLTPTSLLPELLAHQGMDFQNFIRWQIEDGLKQAEIRNNLCPANVPKTPTLAAFG